MYHAYENVNLMEEIVVEINGGITINADVSVKNVMYVKKKIVWNPATCSCKNGKYLASIMDDSSITCDEIKESYDEDADAEDKSNNEANLYNEAKTIPTNFNEKKKKKL